jgi:hypothetical protein
MVGARLAAWSPPITSGGPEAGTERRPMVISRGLPKIQCSGSWSNTTVGLGLCRLVPKCDGISHADPTIRDYTPSWDALSHMAE